VERRGEAVPGIKGRLTQMVAIEEN